MKIFNKNKDKKAKPATELQETKTEIKETAGVKINREKGALAYGILKGVYLSEKSTMLSNYNQYVFKVFPEANKNEVGKTVENLFSVKVKKVKMLNLPGKSKSIGRFSGFRSGYKKAIVVLQKGYTIEQAKP